jgi:ABC-type xylose transport system permease subunit
MTPTSPTSVASDEPSAPGEPDGPADLADERLLREEGLAGALKDFRQRLAGGDLGNVPVILGIMAIAVIFYLQDVTFLSSSNLVNITLSAVPYGIISLGIVVVLLLGEIDLSVGSISGLAASATAVLFVNQGRPLVLSLLVGVGIGIAIGLVYGLIFTRVGVPSFVITLAGLLAFQGLQLQVLGDDGTINIQRDSGLAEFARSKFVGDTVSYVLVVVIAVAYGATRLLLIRNRRAAGLSAPSTSLVAIKTGAILVGLGYLTYYLNVGRGWGYSVVFFASLVLLMDIVLRRTRWGRHLVAVGGNVEAARRAGIKVDRMYVSAFALTGFFAALGGLMFMGKLTSVSQASGGSDVNLTAIAAAVIGGTSLFGGRGSAYSSMLGVIVLVAITSGLNRIGVDSSVRYIVTGAVLLLAVSIDSLARRTRATRGRG